MGIPMLEAKIYADGHGIYLCHIVHPTDVGEDEWPAQVDSEKKARHAIRGLCEDLELEKYRVRFYDADGNLEELTEETL